ncbi:hypothetical protein EVAR_4762_1 [Eumeta japonica]|uniref:Uncharacterized protein n=1 Tax=Eumeta variegata TaxID=151549 RepID=A0A4C1SZM0_EUMVA|nr:hypothetical protein EVAR_4762_1 [Eumeta japonica]
MAKIKRQMHIHQDARSEPQRRVAIRHALKTVICGTDVPREPPGCVENLTAAKALFIRACVNTADEIGRWRVLGVPAPAPACRPDKRRRQFPKDYFSISRKRYCCARCRENRTCNPIIDPYFGTICAPSSRQFPKLNENPRCEGNEQELSAVQRPAAAPALGPGARAPA